MASIGPGHPRPALRHQKSPESGNFLSKRRFLSARLHRFSDRPLRTVRPQIEKVTFRHPPDTYFRGSARLRSGWQPALSGQCERPQFATFS